MGPCTLLDLIGLDTEQRLGEAFYPSTLDPRAAVPPIVRRMLAAGILGQKSGRGLLGSAAPREPATAGHEFHVVRTRDSRSFTEGHAFLARQVDASAGVTLCLGGAYPPASSSRAGVVELCTEDRECGV